MTVGGPSAPATSAASAAQRTERFEPREDDPGDLSADGRAGDDADGAPPPALPTVAASPPPPTCRTCSRRSHWHSPLASYRTHSRSPHRAPSRSSFTPWRAPSSSVARCHTTAPRASPTGSRASSEAPARSQSGVAASSASPITRTLDEPTHACSSVASNWTRTRPTATTATTATTGRAAAADRIAVTTTARRAFVVVKVQVAQVEHALDHTPEVAPLAPAQPEPGGAQSVSHRRKVGGGAPCAVSAARMRREHREVAQHRRRARRRAERRVVEHGLVEVEVGLILPARPHHTRAIDAKHLCGRRVTRREDA